MSKKVDGSRKKRDARIVAAYVGHADATLRGVGERFGVSGERVRQILALAGQPGKGSGRPRAGRGSRTCSACGVALRPGGQRKTCSEACSLEAQRLSRERELARRDEVQQAQRVERPEVARLARKGWTRAAIASELGICVGTVYRALRQAGLVAVGDWSTGSPSRQRLRRAAYQRAKKVRALFDSGWTLTELRAEFGVSRGTLRGDLVTCPAKPSRVRRTRKAAPTKRRPPSPRLHR